MSLPIRDIEQIKTTQTACIPFGDNTTPSVYVIHDIGPTGTFWTGVVSSVKASIEIVEPSEVASLTIEDSSDLPYRILRPIPVIIEKDDDCVIASFNEANIHASGDDASNAMTNLKSYIGDVFEEFLQIGRERLGPGPRRELAILEQYVQEHP
jgi:hypothetical protein